MAEKEVVGAANGPPDLSHCAVCDSTMNIKRCGKCLSVSYCGPEHQTRDWQHHKKICLSLRAAASDNTNGKKLCNESAGKNNQREGKSADSPKLNMTYEFDKRPYKPGVFADPAGKDADSLALHITSQLKQHNFCVVNDIFNPKLARAILKEVLGLHSTGIFIEGQLSGGKTSGGAAAPVAAALQTKTIRGDEITWLEGTERQYPYTCVLVKTLDGLVSRMNQHLKGQCDVAGRTKAMVACYPGNGTGYACHVDNPHRDGRCITCLFYLNENWDAKVNGGLLRIFQGTEDYVDVEPVLNRAIFFWSDRRNPHEVQPAFKTRYAITVWYFDKLERQQARQAAKAQTTDEDISNLNKKYEAMKLTPKEAGQGDDATQETNKAN